MKAFLALLLASAASPVLGQQGGPADGASTATVAPGPTCLPEHAAMGHCTLPAPVPQPSPSSSEQPACLPEHAAMGHCKLPEPTVKPAEQAPQPTCLPEHAAMGHCKLSGTVEQQVQPGPTPPEALSGPAHAADSYWGTEGMQRSRNILREEHGGMPAFKLLVDRAEARFRDGRDGYLLDTQAWYGGDIDKLWLKSEVEGSWGKDLEHAEAQALWSHAVGPWFDLQAGVRFDPQHGPNRTHLVLGVQGLAPYWWEVEGAAFLSNKGDLTARAEAEYDLRITQKLILQPRAEVDLSLQDVPELSIGSGLTNAALGLRLRYQVSPLVAPYIGVEYERAFGDTRQFLQAEGEDPGGFNLLAGVRFWF